MHDIFDFSVTRIKRTRCLYGRRIVDRLMRSRSPVLVHHPDLGFFRIHRLDVFGRILTVDFSVCRERIISADVDPDRFQILT